MSDLTGPFLSIFILCWSSEVLGMVYDDCLNLGIVLHCRNKLFYFSYVPIKGHCQDQIREWMNN